MLLMGPVINRRRGRKTPQRRFTECPLRAIGALIGALRTLGDGSGHQETQMSILGLPIAKLSFKEMNFNFKLGNPIASGG
jgi:hypothetical protein